MNSIFDASPDLAEAVSLEQTNDVIKAVSPDEVDEREAAVDAVFSVDNTHEPDEVEDAEGSLIGAL